MDDDDDGGNSGLSSWAWHELGRQSEQHDQWMMQAAQSFRARLRGEQPVDVDALIAEIHSLRAHNQALANQVVQLNASVQASYEKFKDIKAWAEEAYALYLKEHKARLQERIMS